MSLSYQHRVCAIGARVSQNTDVTCGSAYTHVEDSVDKHVDAVCLRYFDGVQELLLGAPPRGNSTLLVELSQVPLRDRSVVVLHE